MFLVYRKVNQLCVCPLFFGFLSHWGCHSALSRVLLYSTGNSQELYAVVKEVRVTSLCKNWSHRSQRPEVTQLYRTGTQAGPKAQVLLMQILLLSDTVHSGSSYPVQNKLHCFSKTETDLLRQFLHIQLPILLSDALKLHHDRRQNKAEEAEFLGGENWSLQIWRKW